MTLSEAKGHGEIPSVIHGSPIGKPYPSSVATKGKEINRDPVSSGERERIGGLMFRLTNFVHYKILVEASWVIFEQYLIVQLRSPTFSTSEEYPHKVMISICLSSLSRAMHRKSFLTVIGNDSEVFGQWHCIYKLLFSLWRSLVLGALSAVNNQWLSRHLKPTTLPFGECQFLLSSKMQGNLH
ncbi:hypothetical protein Gotur_005806 [Gossypium turneri]